MGASSRVGVSAGPVRSGFRHHAEAWLDALEQHRVRRHRDRGGAHRKGCDGLAEQNAEWIENACNSMRMWCVTGGVRSPQRLWRP
jgi:hypothetical protein